MSLGILVVDDEKLIRWSVGERLQRDGYEVLSAESGEQALDFVAASSPDVMLLDVKLPGIDGLSVCRKLREQARRETPILMLTARDTLEDKITGLDAGADDYLVKPFEIRELEARRTLRTEVDGKGYFVKIHRGIGWAEIAKNLLTAKLPVLGAGQEWKAIQRLRQAGVPSMTAVAA